MKSMKMLLFVLLIIVISVIVFLNSSKKTSNSNKSKITLACVTCVLTAHVWVADTEGLFADNNVDLDIRRFTSGKAALEAMLHEDDIDICTVAQTPVMLNSFNYDNFAIIGSMVTSDDNNKILARKDTGITKPQDLKGKTVAVTYGTSAQYFFNIYLTLNNISPDDLTIVDMPPLDMVEAISNNTVDVICVWEPFILNAQNLLGENSFILPTKGLYREDFYFVAKKDFINNNQDKVENFLRSIVAAETVINAESQKSQEIVASQLNVKTHEINQIWGQFGFNLKLDQIVFISLEDEAEWAINAGWVDHEKMPDYLNLIKEEPLANIDANRVTIIK